MKALALVQIPFPHQKCLIMLLMYIATYYAGRIEEEEEEEEDLDILMV